MDGGRWEEVHPTDGINDAREETYEILPGAFQSPARTSSWCAPPTCSAMSPPPASRSSSRRRLLVVRAGALGDILLLRPAIAGLLRADCDVTLLAPRGPGSVLLGSGIEALLPWESPELAPLLLGEPLRPSLEEQLRSFDAALALTRDQALVEALRERIPELARVDPEPAAGRSRRRVVRAGRQKPRRQARQRRPRAARRSPASKTGAAAALAAPLPAGFLAIHAGSGSPRKNWPAERFAALAQPRSRSSVRARGRPRGP